MWTSLEPEEGLWAGNLEPEEGYRPTLSLKRLLFCRVWKRLPRVFWWVG